MLAEPERGRLGRERGKSVLTSPPKLPPKLGRPMWFRDRDLDCPWARVWKGVYGGVGWGWGGETNAEANDDHVEDGGGVWV